MGEMGDVVKRYKLLGIDPGDLMYRTVTTVNNTVLYI